MKIGDVISEIADPPLAAGFLFGHPVQAGSPTGRLNKILWVLREMDKGDALTIHAQLSDESRDLELAASDRTWVGGVLIPSGFNVPTPGCWHFTLRWGVRQVELSLEYV